MREPQKQIQVEPFLWPLIRQIFGWFCILVGVITTPLPIPVGIPLIVVGVLVVGKRNRRIRWIRVHLLLLIRYWAAQNHPILTPLARWLRKQKRKFLRLWIDFQERRRQKAEQLARTPSDKEDEQLRRP
jgi:hypothetical protein